MNIYLYIKIALFVFSISSVFVGLYWINKEMVEGIKEMRQENAKRIMK